MCAVHIASYCIAIFFVLRSFEEPNDVKQAREALISRITLYTSTTIV